MTNCDNFNEIFAFGITIVNQVSKLSFDDTLYTWIGLILSRVRKLHYPVNGRFE